MTCDRGRELLWSADDENISQIDIGQDPIADESAVATRQFSGGEGA